MLEQLKSMIYRLFGKKLVSTDTELQLDRYHAQKYYDSTSTNITAIFADTLAVLATSDSQCLVEGDTDRAIELNRILSKHWQGIKKYISTGNGTGLVVSIPYSVGGALGRKIYIDTVAKDRVFVTGTQGDDIVSLTVLADVREVDYQTYCRWTDYSVDGGVYTITQWATHDMQRCPLDVVADWASIEPVVKIGGVSRLPIGIYRCPKNNRRSKNITGAPITFGCGETISRIADTVQEIDDEYQNKKSIVFADRTMFDKDDKISANIFKTIGGAKLGDRPFFEIFSPEFRDTSLYNKLEHLFALCEKEVGTSRGILTDLNTSGATATEIRRATYQTFALCDDIHREIESYIDGLVYGVDVLCNFYGITPAGDYKVKYDWSYSMLDDSATTFSQLLSLKQNGAVSTAELRRFYFDRETPEQAQEAIDKIKATEPTLSQLLGD